MSRKLKIGLVFILLGTLSLGEGLYSGYNSINFNAKAVNVESSVTRNIQETCNGQKRKYTCYNPEVSYEYAGQKYKKILSERSSNMYTPGEKIDLKHDPANPHGALSTKSLWLNPILFCLYGFIFGGVGVLLLRNHIRRKKIEENLLKRGVSIRATVVDIGIDKSITVNGIHPYMIRAQFNNPTSNRPIIVVRSELWHDPKASGEISADNTIEVLYDSTNPQQCMIVLGDNKKLKAA